MPYNNDRLSARFITMRNVQTAAKTACGYYGKRYQEPLGNRQSHILQRMHKGYILSGMASASKNAVGNQAETNYDKNKRKQQAQRSKDDCTNPENSCPLLYQSQQILSYQHCHKRIDGKQINAPLTLGDAVEDKDYKVVSVG